ncbi:MAG TPA: DUF4411 domain-containing protein [Brevundimonas sp.]|nr:DUF4411 domain-containing protein [Brevundimonas sp.]
MFLIDANCLITAHNHYYPTNRVPEYWAWIAHHAKAGRLKMPVEIYEEIAVGMNDAEKDLLFGWIKSTGIKNDLVLGEECDLESVQNILLNGYAADLTEIELAKIGRDPFLIAYGRADPAGRCVVTHEQSAKDAKRSKRKIPDVCAQFDVPCCSFWQLLRKLDFKTSWAA